MTTQVDLHKIWAGTGGAIDPDILVPGKYEDGWVVEIPTYENFNWVLQTHSKNILTLAEQGAYAYQANIGYRPGAKVIASDGIVYRSRIVSTSIDPVLDINGVWWVKGETFGLDAANTLNSHGVRIKSVNPGGNPVLWQGNALTLANDTAMIQLETNSAAFKNWLFGNVAGVLVAVDIGTATTAPDSRTLNPTDPSVSRIYHEAYPPTQAEVSGTIPEAPIDGKAYARVNGAWVPVTTTTVGSEPPPAALGAGAAWYNLADGQLYVDINDGTSSQWVPSNPPVVPLQAANITSYSNVTSGLAAVNVQEAIDELAAAGPTLLTSVFPIGPWNMLSTATAGIVHGLAIGDIRNVSAYIIHDTSTIGLDFATGNAAGTSNDGYIQATATSINLRRESGTDFASTSYDNVVGDFNRGWITVQHVAA